MMYLPHPRLSRAPEFSACTYDETLTALCNVFAQANIICDLQFLILTLRSDQFALSVTDETTCLTFASCFCAGCIGKCNRHIFRRKNFHFAKIISSRKITFLSERANLVIENSSKLSFSYCLRHVRNLFH